MESVYPTYYMPLINFPYIFIVQRLWYKNLLLSHTSILNGLRRETCPRYRYRYNFTGGAMFAEQDTVR